VVCKADTSCQPFLSNTDLSLAEESFFAAVVVVVVVVVVAVAVAADGAGTGTDASCRSAVSDVQRGSSHSRLRTCVCMSVPGENIKFC